jgi:hypothetical protein
MSSRFRCRLGKHTWRSRGRGDVPHIRLSRLQGRRVISRPGGAGAHQKHPVVGKAWAWAIELRDGAPAIGAATASRQNRQRRRGREKASRLRFVCGVRAALPMRDRLSPRKTAPRR